MGHMQLVPACPLGGVPQCAGVRGLGVARCLQHVLSRDCTVLYLAPVARQVASLQVGYSHEVPSHVLLLREVGTASRRRPVVVLRQCQCLVPACGRLRVYVVFEVVAARSEPEQGIVSAVYGRGEEYALACLDRGGRAVAP